jgi:pimeloyl-ACP methyl ester carboxylesterase
MLERAEDTDVKIHRSLIHLPGLDILNRDTQAAILCLHGRWGRGETWVDFMRRYGAAHRVLAPDQRGHGLSGKPESSYTTEEMAGDMLALLDFLGIESAIVVGHSMGGAIAGYLAARHPLRVRAVALLDKSAAGPEEPLASPQDGRDPVDPLTQDWPIPFATLSDAREFLSKVTDSETSYRYFMNSLVETVDGYGMLFSRRATGTNAANYRNWFRLLPEIRCPVLLVRARGGDAVPDSDFERMRSMLPDCTAVEMPTPDHNVHLADAEAFYRCFDSFLSRL